MVENLRNSVSLGGFVGNVDSRRMRRMTPITTPTENTERVSRFRRIDTPQENQKRVSRFRPIPNQENSEAISTQNLNMSQMPITREMLENADRVVYIRRTNTPNGLIEEVYSVEQYWEDDE